ncbi:oxidoreductase [Xylaria scruposa]|nr:oxidoreductase [Xylaria scruposa]
MKQWFAYQNGLDKLRMVDVPEPSELKEGEVLVKIHSVSLNFRDTEVCMGVYGNHKSAKQGNEVVPTSDCCGTIVKIGRGVSDSGLKEGDRVASIFNQTHLTGQMVAEHFDSGLGLPLSGCLTQYRVFPAYGLVKVPQYLTDDEAACLPIATVTAWMSINTFQPIDQPLQGKDKVVLLQGTGGVSIAGLQIAKALGLTTIITSSSDAKLERAKKLGADHTINYNKEPDWDEVALKLTNGRGVDVILECGGAQTLTKSFRCVAFGGLISAFGYRSGKEDAAGDRVNTNVLALSRNVTLKGILNGPKDRFEEALRLYEKEQIQPVIDRTFEFEQADEAFKYLFSGSHFGKVVVKVP